MTTFRRSRMADWSQLPYDLIVVIANHLLEVEDFISFSAVCHSWQSVYLKKDWMCCPQIPWLMLCELSEGNIYKRKILSLSRFKFYKISLPEAHGCRCWGTCHGWIVLFGKDFEIRLLNPITRVCIKLPPLSNLIRRPSSDLDWYNVVQKIVVLKLRGKLVTFVIYKYYNCLAFSNVGDCKWTPVSFSIPVHLLDIVCIKDQIFAVTMVGSLMLLQLDGVESPKAFFVVSPPENEKGWSYVYLTESTNYLLMVFKYEQRSVLRFKVYKFDILKRKWVSVNDLGDSFLLVDENGCTSGSTYGYFQPSCIYHVGDNLNSLLEYWHCHASVQNMIVYNVKDEKSEVFRINDHHPSRYTCPVWMMPILWQK